MCKGSCQLIRILQNPFCQQAQDFCCKRGSEPSKSPILRSWRRLPTALSGVQDSHLSLYCLIQFMWCHKPTSFAWLLSPSPESASWCQLDFTFIEPPLSKHQRGSPVLHPTEYILIKERNLWSLTCQHDFCSGINDADCVMAKPFPASKVNNIRI